MFLGEGVLVRPPDQLVPAGCVHPRLEPVLHGRGIHEQALHFWGNDRLLFDNLISHGVLARLIMASGLGRCWASRSLAAALSQSEGRPLHLNHDLQMLCLVVHLSNAVELLDIFIRPVPCERLSCLRVAPLGCRHPPGWHRRCGFEQFGARLAGSTLPERPLHLTGVLGVSRSLFLTLHLLNLGQGARRREVASLGGACVSCERRADHEVVGARELLDARGAPWATEQFIGRRVLNRHFLSFPNRIR